jgi:hypothetical protein
MFAPIARSYKAYNFTAGQVMDEDPTTGFGHHFPTYIEVFAHATLDATVLLGEINVNGGAGFPIPKASGSRYIFVRSSRIEVQGAPLLIIGYFV